MQKIRNCDYKYIAVFGALESVSYADAFEGSRRLRRRSYLLTDLLTYPLIYLRTDSLTHLLADSPTAVALTALPRLAEKNKHLGPELCP